MSFADDLAAHLATTEPRDDQPARLEPLVRAARAWDETVAGLCSDHVGTYASDVCRWCGRPVKGWE